VPFSLRKLYAAFVFLLIAHYCSFCQILVDEHTAKSGSAHLPAPEKREDGLAAYAFQSAYGLINQLAVKDRIEVLLHLSRAAQGKFPAKSGRWAEEALATSRQLRVSKEQARYEWQAISNLAVVNSEKALELLATLDAPAVAPEYDPRTKAAETVFSRFLEKYPQKLEQIYVAAQEIGDHGFYPFAAVQSVITGIAAKDAAMASAFAQQAIRYYNLGAHTPVAMNQFAALLLQHFAIVPPQMLKATVTGLVATILDQESSRNGSEDSHSVWAGLNATTLALLMPLVESVDEDLAQKLKNKVSAPDARSMAVTMASEEEPTVTSQITVIESNRAGTPEAATPSGLPQISLETPPSTSNEKLDESLKNAESALRQAESDEEKLAILMEMVRELVSAGRKSMAREIVAEIFVRAETLFKKSVNEEPEANWSARSGSPELITLVDLTAREMPGILLASIRTIATPVLQAHLYAAAGEALQRPAEIPSFVTLQNHSDTVQH